jgi:hypothetical protein
VIALWATVEQYLSRCLVVAEGALGTMPNDAGSFRWNDLDRRYVTVGIDLRSLTGHAAVNECRVLNNKIKHLGIVDDELSSFPHFAHRRGTRLTDIELDLQRYVNGVFEFVGHTLESADAAISTR